MESNSSITYDIIVVGGGSAGAALASRLSEDPLRNVLLLEAGKAYQPDTFPEVIAKADHVTGDEDHDWGYSADTGISGRKIRAFRGKVLGGSSSVNAAVAIRARKSDFDKWVELGLSNWSFDCVLDTYRQMEHTRDGDDAIRGRNGLFPIRQVPFEELTPGLRAFVDATIHQGFNRVSDFNGYDQDGVSPYPLNVLYGIRQNTGMTYLNAAVRKRRNLTIIAGQMIDRVLIKNRLAYGVITVDGHEYRGAEVILSAGTYGSPSILMRSGIGPKDDLAALGIEIVKEAPVGKKLYEHPFYYNVYELKREANAMSPAAGAILWTGSASAPAGELDIHVSATHLFDPSLTQTGGALVLACAVTTPDSKGFVKLASTDPLAAPIIELNLLQQKRDQDRMVEAVNISRRIGLDLLFEPVRERELFPGMTVLDNFSLTAAILGQIDVYQHPTSTVPMGIENDPEAVVDRWGKVYGVEGLRVLDASIMPVIVSAPPNVTVIMMAEHLFKNIYQNR
jgi:choline dehydrogenase